MRDSRPGGATTGPRLDRRAWLAGLVGVLAAPAGDGSGDEDREAAEAEGRARNLGLKPFRSLASTHFRAVGNAPDAYLRLALTDCEAVARDFLEHFAAKGFPVAFPARRMTAVVLEDERAFARFVGLPPRRPAMHGISVLGIYQREENRLVLQDFRNVPGSLTGVPAWAGNLETLAHEATHQLTFNTGLLDREGDVPRSLAEGFAAYGEVRRPNARSLPGQVNHRRLHDLAHHRRKLGWMPVARLLADEGWRAGAEVDVGQGFLLYAEGWLLVHYLMTVAERTPGFRRYLEAIRGRRDPAHRLDDARAHLGDLDELDGALKRYSIRLLRER